MIYLKKYFSVQLNWNFFPSSLYLNQTILFTYKLIHDLHNYVVSSLFSFTTQCNVSYWFYRDWASELSIGESGVLRILLSIGIQRIHYLLISGPVFREKC